MHLSMRFVIVFGLLLLSALNHSSWAREASKCNPQNYVYGYNEPIDQVLLCAVSKTSDLDLIPKGELVKSTPRTLVEQGFSNKTLILYAKLAGLWTARRAKLVETGWRCGENTTTSSALIEFNGLSLNVIERVDIPLSHKNGAKLAHHRPCKALDLPTWMCRQTRPLYRTTRTWTNRAYLNLTLAQQADESRPRIKSLDLIGACRDTFAQKITYSPSAMHVIAKFLTNQNAEDDKPHKKRDTGEEVGGYSGTRNTFQVGKGLMYPSTVSLILNHATSALESAITECMDTLDLDLSLLAQQQSSFTNRKFSADANSPSNQLEGARNNRCAGDAWLVKELENSLRADADKELPRGAKEAHDKRSQQLLNYPADPDRLLNPYGYYYENAGLLEAGERDKGGAK